MMPVEKQRLLEFLDNKKRWCQHVEARDAKGNPVRCDDETAAAWDITGAIFRLFGCQRAYALYAQLDRHVNGKRRALGWPPRDLELDGMAALQEFNDREDTTFEVLRTRLESIHVWSGRTRSNGAIPP